MEPTERKSKALTLVASGNDEKGLTERRYCKALLDSFQCFTSDVPPPLSSAAIWSPIPNDKEIGREEAFYRRTDHRLPA